MSEAAKHSYQFSAVSFQLFDKRRQHLFDFNSFLGEFLKTNIIQHSQIMRKQQMILQFGGRTHGNLKKSRKIGVTISAATFGNVGGNRGAAAT
jgi:hypothetical protein